MKAQRSLVRNIILGLVVIFSLIPIYLVILASLRSTSNIFGDPLNFPWPFDLSNYSRAWNEANFRIYFINSFKIAIPATVIVTVLGTLAGYAFAKIPLRGSQYLFSFLLIGMVVPVPAIIVSLHKNLVSMGLINHYLGVVLPQAALTLPFATFMMRSFFESIPSELFSAARIDGASELSLLRYIVLPLAKPGLRALIVIQFMFVWQEYLLPLVIIQSDDIKPLTFGIMSFLSRYGIDYTGIAAGSVICFLPIVIVYFLLQKSFVEGLTLGAWK